MKELKSRQERIDTLEAELKESKEQCRDLQLQIEALAQTEHMYNESVKLGGQLRACMQGFVDAGFTEDQAYELMIVSIKKYA